MKTFTPHPKQEPRFKKPPLPINKFKAATGELILFRKIHQELNGKSQITGKYLPFDVKNFFHILSKGARPDLRLERENVGHGEFLFHWFYDNRSKEAVLQRFPKSEWVYQKKEHLKSIKPEKK